MIDESTIRQIVSNVLREYSTIQSTGNYGSTVFPSMEEAILAAVEAQKKLVKLSLDKRMEIVDAMRKKAREKTHELCSLAVEETGMGRVDDKIGKFTLTVDKTPGPEILKTEAFSGDHGLTIVERAPFGVIGAITPSTNPHDTVFNNGVSMISGGNTVTFNPHPSAKKVSQMCARYLNEASISVGGPDNLLTMVEEPTLDTADVLMKNKYIKLLVVTGGPGVVNAAFNSQKKVICGGPGNPPVIIDETADISFAAEQIVFGASFDNNILCIAEKEAIILDKVANDFFDAFDRQSVYKLNTQQIDSLTKTAFVKFAENGEEPVFNRKLVGHSPQVLAREAGFSVPDNVRLLYAEVDAEHPFVHGEQLMPFLPIVRVRNFDEALELGLRAEAGNNHTASIFSKNIEHMSEMARMFAVSIFVKNGPTLSGLGFQGEGYTTMTIATPTGEGITTAATFTRTRRCVIRDYFRIV